MAWAKFYEDPDNNPLATPSGKIEFYSERLAKHFPDDQERAPIPKWVEKGEQRMGRLPVGAYVTERIMPGAVSIDHGARFDPIIVGELDRGRAINTLTPHALTSKNTSGMVVSSFLTDLTGRMLKNVSKPGLC